VSYLLFSSRSLAVKQFSIHQRRAICDFERGRWGWTNDGDERRRTIAARMLNRDQIMEISRLSSGESLVCVRENLIFDAFVDF